MQERRKSPRFKCRLHCILRRADDRIRGRVLDVSEGGLCLLSPVEVEAGLVCGVDVEAPDGDLVEVEATIWHTRSLQSRSHGMSFWSVGLMITKSDQDYQDLIGSVAVAGTAWSAPHPLERAGQDAGLRTFRVRVKATTGPRTRLLTVAAASEDEARRLATADLEGRWVILDVKRA